jgi:hypothetical protein
LTPVSSPHLFHDGRRPDILVSSWRGRPVAFDLTVVSPLCQSHLTVAAADNSSLLDSVASTKLTKYARDLAAANIDFVPLVLDAFGSLPPDLQSTFRFIARLTRTRLVRKSASIYFLLI